MVIADCGLRDGARELEGTRALGITTVMVAGIICGLWPERIEEPRYQADYGIETLSELLAAEKGDGSLFHG